MKKISSLALIFLPLLAWTQQDSTKHHNNASQEKTTYFGVKAGLNFSNVTNASSISAGNQTGFHVGILFNTGGKILGSRMELLYSQQGYSYANDSAQGNFTHNYIMMAQLLAVNITKFVQVQAGFQFGYLLNAKVEDTKSTGNATVDNLLSYYNRWDYGFSGGIEVHPFLGILVGVRYNISFNSLYKNLETSAYNPPGMTTFTTPSIDVKNNIVQVFVGYHFYVGRSCLVMRQRHVWPLIRNRSI